MKASYQVEAGYIAKLVPEIAAERISQMMKWSDCQNLPDGTGGDYQDEMLNAQRACNVAYSQGDLTHAHIFGRRGVRGSGRARRGQAAGRAGAGAGGLL